MKWSKFALLTLAFLSTLLVTDGVFLAMPIHAHSLGTVLGSILTPFKSASEPSLLLIIGAFLIVIAVRVRSIFGAKRDAQ